MILITNLSRKKITENNWAKIKNRVLGKNYDLSLVFAGNSLMKKLNSRYRGRGLPAEAGRPASVLSFPLSKKQGEVFINVSQKKYSPSSLFIHALLHLKNFKHGVRMKEQEEKLTQKYFHGPRYSHRP
jgi:ssRNA-specific RNase YbeY (16S rRNA maturation enzyme)